MATQVFFEKELERLINMFSKEAESNTPDFILAEYIQDCLDAYNRATRNRDKWYGFQSFDNIPESVKTINL